MLKIYHIFNLQYQIPSPSLPSPPPLDPHPPPPKKIKTIHKKNLEREIIKLPICVIHNRDNSIQVFLCKLMGLLINIYIYTGTQDKCMMTANC